MGCTCNPSSQDPVAVIKCEYFAHSRRLLRNLDLVFLCSINYWTSNVLPLPSAPSQASSSQNSNVDTFSLDGHNPFKTLIKILKTLPSLLKKFKSEFKKFLTPLYREIRNLSSSHLATTIQWLIQQIVKQCSACNLGVDYPKKNSILKSQIYSVISKNSM